MHFCFKERPKTVIFYVKMQNFPGGFAPLDPPAGALSLHPVGAWAAPNPGQFSVFLIFGSFTHNSCSAFCSILLALCCRQVQIICLWLTSVNHNVMMMCWICSRLPVLCLCCPWVWVKRAGQTRWQGRCLTTRPPFCWTSLASPGTLPSPTSSSQR